MAALDVYPVLQNLELFDRNKPFLAIARKLLEPSAKGRTMTFLTRDVTWGDSLPSADIVTAGYVFAELHESDLRERARMLWWSTGTALVITEPGTPDGFHRLRQIRETLLLEGAHVAAPCTHHNACPMSGDAWCRVPVRLQRSRDHRALKGGALGHEDEPVAYLALTRAPPANRLTARVIAEPAANKAGITIPSCGADGLFDIRVPARDHKKYRQYSKLRWGDAV
jgi:ribosomal protein RSM22 (predicted rRNA methylase)